MNNDKKHQFELLVREHKRTIYTVCYMFSHNKAEIDDLFQEILIRLWNGFDHYEGRSSARTWIYRVALNTAINQDKKQRRRIETVPLSVDINPFEADNPKTEQVRKLHDLISQLELIDRSLVLLWLEGISYDEIGAIIGITPNNVGVRLARIKEKLVQMSKKQPTKAAPRTAASSLLRNKRLDPKRLTTSHQQQLALPNTRRASLR